MAAPIDVLKDQARGTTSLRAGVMTRLLVGGAVTLSCALLLVSGLMIKSVVELGRASYAFTTEDVLLARTELDETAYPTDASIIDFVERLSERHRRSGRCAACGDRDGGAARRWRVLPAKEGRRFQPPEDQPAVRRIAATPSYFDALQLRATCGPAC